MSAPNMIRVTADGALHFQDKTFKCALGRSGMASDKVEGDGITPIGTYPLRSVLFRPDRLSTPITNLPVAEIQESDGWCDDPQQPEYNQQITFPCKGSAEHLWRNDAVYDVIVVLGHNDGPIIKGAGSAIFMHVAKPDYTPTEGCVALALNDLLTVLAGCDQDTLITLEQGG